MTTATKRRELPAIFGTPMVRALLDGRKTQTRRTHGWLDEVNARPDDWARPVLDPTDGRWVFTAECGQAQQVRVKPRYQVGDILRVNEALVKHQSGYWCYAADIAAIELSVRDPRAAEMIAWAHHKDGRTQSPRYMPKWAARIWLEVTDVRAERVQDISRADAHAEGFWPSDLDGMEHFAGKKYGNANLAFAACWDSINAKRGYPWSHNPWEFAYTFKRVERGEGKG